MSEQFFEILQTDLNCLRAARLAGIQSKATAIHCSSAPFLLWQVSGVLLGYKHVTSIVLWYTTVDIVSLCPMHHCCYTLSHAQLLFAGTCGSAAVQWGSLLSSSP